MEQRRATPTLGDLHRATPCLWPPSPTSDTSAPIKCRPIRDRHHGESAPRDIVVAHSVTPGGPVKQLLAAVLIGVAIAGVGLAAEAVFAKPINQAGTVTIPQARS